MSQSVFLLIDLHNGGILLRAKNREVMNGLLEGIIDTIPFQMFTELWPTEYEKHDFSNDLLLYSPLDRRIHPMPENLVTPNFLDRRKRAKEKARSIHTLQLLCEAARDTNTLGVPQEIYADLETELTKCRPENGEYSDGIHAYAGYLGLDPGVCFQELRMKVETGRIQRIRNYAVYRKYLDLIHVTDESGLKQLFVDLNNELFFNSHV